MLIPLLFCAMCCGQSVKAVSLGQTNSFESGGVLSESLLIPPLASLLRSGVSELPPSMIATTPNVTAAVALEGYIVERHAGFFSCNLWVSAKSQQLNSCSKGSNGEYIRLTATSTDQAIRSYYTDSKCATTPKSQGTIRLQACSIFGHTNVYSSTSAPPSPRPFVKITGYGSNDKTCAASATDTEEHYVATDTCVWSTPLYVTTSGSTITVNEYSGYNCDGNYVTTTFTDAVCLNSTMFTLSAATVYNAKSCFAGSETVSVESVGATSIADIRAGDRVLAADATGRTFYSDVVFVPHGPNKDSALFVQITTAHGRDVKMTQSHILPSGTCNTASSLPLPLPLVYAKDVNVGDCIMTVSGQERVSAVGIVQGQGLYTIVTKEEFVVVNGIIASSFATNHMMANLYYNMHRFLYSTAPALLKTSLLRSMNEALGLLIPLFGYSI